MPSKSRKKIKGQARKANKAAAANNTSGDTSLQSLANTCCEHGLIKTNNKHISDFINTFFKIILNNISGLNNNLSLSAKSTADALSGAYNKFPEAINNESNREIIKNNFISTGVSFLLGMLGPDNSAIMAHTCAAAVMIIDSYVPSSPAPLGRLDHRDAKIWMRNVDIMGGCQRSLVKYFVTRSTCNCLDELYAQIKSIMPKMGKCLGCNQMKERTGLFICTGCERIQYCSKACQIANVPKHKDMCKQWQKYDRAQGLH